MTAAVRFIGRYGTFRVGQVIRPPATFRNILLSRKVVEIVDEVSKEKPVPLAKRSRKKSK